MANKRKENMKPASFQKISIKRLTGNNLTIENLRKIYVPKIMSGESWSEIETIKIPIAELEHLLYEYRYAPGASIPSIIKSLSRK